MKVFPVDSVGCKYIKDVKSPLSNVRILAVGGVDENNMQSYFEAGAVGIGIGSGIVKKQMIENEDFEGITNLARKYTNNIEENK